MPVDKSDSKICEPGRIELNNAKEDLWSEFADDEPEGAASANEPAVLKKSTAKDGSEWSGSFDRRTKPRDDMPNMQQNSSGKAEAK